LKSWQRGNQTLKPLNVKHTSVNFVTTDQDKMSKLPVQWIFLVQPARQTEIFSFSTAMAYNSPTFAHPARRRFSEGGLQH